jgi:hypothetical protein
MLNRHLVLYGNKVSRIDLCGKTVGWYIGTQGVYEPPFETKPTTGKHDYKICEGCQNNMKTLTKQFKERYNGTDKKEGFPFCCEFHRNLLSVKEFKRADFDKVPEIAALKIIYTHQHIENNFNLTDYYKDITDYIEYTVDSFGQMPSGCGEPLFASTYLTAVTHAIEHNSDIPLNKRKTLLEFLKTNYSQTETSNTDVNILINTYQKWLKIFPFELSFFKSLKEKFEQTLPLLSSKPETNKYSGVTKAKLHTPNSLIEVLQSLTLKLLDNVDIPKLKKEGVISDVQATQLEFSEASLKTKSAEITNQFSTGELKYVKALKKWIKIHKAYFKENETIFLEMQRQSTESMKVTPKEFEKWLKQNNLHAYYLQNPEQHQALYEDYQRSQAFEDIDEWIKWYVQNPKMAERHFPHFTASLERRVKESPPYMTANLIQKLPENHYIWKSDIEKLDGRTKQKKVEEQIELLDFLLNKVQFETEIEQEAVESVRDELEEQLKFWKNELANIKKPVNVTSSLDGEFKKVITAIVESGIEIIDNPEYYKLLANHFEKGENNQRENSRTFHFSEKLNGKLKPNYNSETQHETGKSGTSKSTGTVDISISSHNATITKCEAVNFRGLNSNKLGADLIFHLNKLMRNYNASSIKNLCFLVYFEGSKSNFFKSFGNYKYRINRCDKLEYTCFKVKDITSEFVTNSNAVKVLKSTHSYSKDNENLFNVYHFYFDFSE